MLILPFLPSQIKPPLLFGFPTLPAKLLIPDLHFLPLQLERLLGLCTDAGFPKQLPDAALSPLGVFRSLPDSGFNRRAELQLVVVPEDKLQHLAVLRLSPKGDLAHGQPPL